MDRRTASVSFINVVGNGIVIPLCLGLVKVPIPVIIAVAVFSMVVVWLWGNTPSLGWRKRVLPILLMGAGAIAFAAGATLFYNQSKPVAVVRSNMLTLQQAARQLQAIAIAETPDPAKKAKLQNLQPFIHMICQFAPVFNSKGEETSPPSPVQSTDGLYVRGDAVALAQAGIRKMQPRGTAVITNSSGYGYETGLRVRGMDVKADNVHFGHPTGGGKAFDISDE